MRELLLLFLVGMLIGCSFGPSKLDLKQQSALVKVERLAILPVEIPITLTRERAEIFESLLATELSSRGYSILDRAVTRTVCSSGACNLEEIFGRYKADALVRLKIDSSNRTNVIAAYYNALDGDLVIESDTGAQLATVSHTESERGGALFNTGQVIEAIRSTVRNVDEDPFDRLAAKFVKAIVRELPQRKVDSTAAPAQSAATPLSYQLRSRGGASATVCASTNANQQVFVVSGRSRSPLREVMAGRYCGVFLREILEQEGVRIEANSAFGRLSSVELEATGFESCRLSYLPRLDRKDGTVTLSLSCHQVPSCEEDIAECVGVRYIWYRSVDGSGQPLEKLTESMEPRLVLDSPARGRFAVLAVPKSGVVSRPLFFDEVANDQ